MKVTVRKGPPTAEHPEGPVVAEVWMSVDEARAKAYSQVGLEDAMTEATEEHLRARYRVTRQVKVHLKGLA